MEIPFWLGSWVLPSTSFLRRVFLLLSHPCSSLGVRRVQPSFSLHLSLGNGPAGRRAAAAALAVSAAAGATAADYWPGPGWRGGAGRGVGAGPAAGRGFTGT